MGLTNKQTADWLGLQLKWLERHQTLIKMQPPWVSCHLSEILFWVRPITSLEEDRNIVTKRKILGCQLDVSKFHSRLEKPLGKKYLHTWTYW